MKQQRLSVDQIGKYLARLPSGGRKVAVAVKLPPKKLPNGGPPKGAVAVKLPPPPKRRVTAWERVGLDRPRRSRKAQAPPSTTGQTSLVVAANVALDKWRGLRTFQGGRSELGLVIEFLHSIGVFYVGDVGDEALGHLREWTLNAGLSVATLSRRVSCLRAVGVRAPSVPLPRVRQWYLSVVEEDRLRGMAAALPHPLLAFVLWTVTTGLRVEESLAVRWGDVDLVRGTVRVSGLKTAMAQALLPLSAEAVSVLVDHASVTLPYSADPSCLVFNVPYNAIRDQWNIARGRLGLSGVPTATLKSLRRSFARRAHLNGMPVDVLRQYLRHGSIATTQRYLWLVGGYSQDEMRRWL